MNRIAIVLLVSFGFMLPMCSLAGERSVAKASQRETDGEITSRLMRLRDDLENVTRQKRDLERLAETLKEQIKRKRPPIRVNELHRENGNLDVRRLLIVWRDIATSIQEAGVYVSAQERTRLSRVVNWSFDRQGSPPAVVFFESWDAIWSVYRRASGLHVYRADVLDESGSIAEVPVIAAGRWGTVAPNGLLDWQVTDEVYFFSEDASSLVGSDLTFLPDAQPGLQYVLPVRLSGSAWTLVDEDSAFSWTKGGSVGFIIMVLGVAVVAIGGFQLATLGRASQGIYRQSNSPIISLNNPLGRVMHVSFQYHSVDRDVLEVRLLKVFALEKARLRQGIGFLKLASGLAPLLGLMGTVIGMIRTFDSLGVTPAGMTAELTAGIATALITTQLGMVVAIPALILYGVTSSWYEVLSTRLQAYVAGVLADWMQQNAWEQSGAKIVPKSSHAVLNGVAL